MPSSYEGVFKVFFPFRKSQVNFLCKGLKFSSSISVFVVENELPLSFNESPQCDAFTLPNGTKLNCLLYADDLVILSRSKEGLKNCLKNLEAFNSKWLLDVNLKKTKVMVFNKTGKKLRIYLFLLIIIHQKLLKNTPIQVSRLRHQEVLIYVRKLQLKKD